MDKKNKNKMLCVGSWLLVLIACVVGGILLVNKQAFTGVMQYIVLAVLAIIGIGLLVITSISKKNTVSIVNVVIAIVVFVACILVPGKAKDSLTFTEPSRVGLRHINFYVLSEDYRSAHEDDFSFTKPSQNVEDYTNKTFILQKEMNQSDQDEAITAIKKDMGVDDVKTVTYDTISEAVQALYKNEGDVLVLNEAFEDTLKKSEDYASFTTDTFVLYTAQIGEETAEEPTDTSGMQPFVVYVAGNDTRDSALTLYGRTDTDMIMAVNPARKQILLVSIPRDFYVKNPALGNELDKLTHLGNDGIQNTLDGINQEFGLDIHSYLTTNFAHFVNLVDEIGGIDIYNPYSFEGQNSGNYSFPQGDLHMDGEMALAYSRERYSLSDGDYGRNAHQGIAMEGILTKVQELTGEGQYTTVLKALSENFLTNLNINDMYGMLKGKTEGDWEFIKYHLGGEGTYAGTVSMGFDRQLYVCKPFDSQVNFAKEQVEQVLTGEQITQQDLPDAGSTTFMEN